MTQDSTPASRWQQALQAAIALSENLQTHPEAQAAFAALQPQLLAENAELAQLLQLLWERYIQAQRGAAFWQEMSDAEKALADQAVRNGMQMKQNYMRLMQEM
jgi:hypothetical protein